MKRTPSMRPLAHTSRKATYHPVARRPHSWWQNSMYSTMYSTMWTPSKPSKHCQSLRRPTSPHVHGNFQSLYISLLFIDYSSGFNTIVPFNLAFKVRDLYLNPQFPDWQTTGGASGPSGIMFPHPQHQGPPGLCAEPSAVFSLHPRLQVTTDSNIIVKFTDDLAVVDLISNSDETAYCSEIPYLVDWCRGNSQVLQIKSQKDLHGP